MTRLTASLSKKRRGPEEFSSDCFSAAMEIEIGDNLTPEQINQRLAQLHGLLESEVDQQIARASAPKTSTPGAWNGDCRRIQAQAKPNGVAPKSVGQANGDGRQSISEPQQRAIAAISKTAGLTRERFGVKSVEADNERTF